MFDNYPKRKNNLPDGTILSDISNHCDNWNYYRIPGDQSTSAHETTHGINSQIRNASNVNGDNKNNGFYCLQDRSIALPEPKCHKSDVAKFVPTSLRFSRYGMYVVGQKDWDSTPLYVFDEAVAYANGAACAIEIDKKGLIIDEPFQDELIDRTYSICCEHLFGGDGSDRIFGVVEFMAYCTAVLMAAPKPLDARLIEFTKWHLERSATLYNVGRTLYPWHDMDACFETLKSSTEAAEMRKFQKDVIGYDITGGTIPNNDETNYYV